MLEALLKLFGKKEPSGKVAHNRLKVVLIHDRANVSPEMMENLRNDIIEVISKYMDINKKEMKISLTMTIPSHSSRTSRSATCVTKNAKMTNRLRKTD